MLTKDNRTENALYLEIVNIDAYFCVPYHNWEKGSIENYNG